MLKTRVNQPTRAFISSNDDVDNQSTLAFNSFTTRFRTPILNAKKCQLLRATIPNATQNIPNYQLMFFYYALPSADDVGDLSGVPSAAFLRCVRLYPSNWVPPSGYTTYSKNRYFTDPADLVTALNIAAGANGDNVTYNPIWTAGDIVFAYNATTRQITFGGTNVAAYYCNAGWNDPNVAAYMATNAITTPNFGGGGTTIQPYVRGYTLNLRVGYAMSGNAPNPQITLASTLCANLTNRTFVGIASTGNPVPVDSYPNLVYTGSVYLYADIIAGSSISSSSTYNMLSVIPNNTVALGVIQYVAATLTWLDKLSDTIYEIRISMFDDANQPFLLPDSAVVNLELGFSYD